MNTCAINVLSHICSWWTLPLLRSSRWRRSWMVFQNKFRVNDLQPVSPSCPITQHQSEFKRQFSFTCILDRGYGFKPVEPPDVLNVWRGIAGPGCSWAYTGAGGWSSLHSISMMIEINESLVWVSTMIAGKICDHLILKSHWKNKSTVDMLSCWYNTFDADCKIQLITVSYPWKAGYWQYKAAIFNIIITFTKKVIFGPFVCWLVG